LAAFMADRPVEAVTSIVAQPVLLSALALTNPSAAGERWTRRAAAIVTGGVRARSATKYGLGLKNHPAGTSRETMTLLGTSGLGCTITLARCCLGWRATMR
jgi:hypothetical protein